MTTKRAEIGLNFQNKEGDGGWDDFKKSIQKEVRKGEKQKRNNK